MATEKLGRYEILSELGQGAMGVVYKAIDPLIERTVAIKTIKLDLSQEELANFEERFYREAKSAGRLNHPNIVTIYDVGKSDHVAYMAMEYLEGQVLRDILDTHSALSVDKIAEVIAQVADGLAYAHENGIVHRDIKPANIMLVRDGVAKITDFGIAQMPTGSRTLAGTVLGSPKYMSPEQVIGQNVDGRSDIFSLGVVLYEMLTGESPFSGDNISTIMYRILNETPPTPGALNPKLPEAFNYIVDKALAKHPADRYQSAKEMEEDLMNYQRLSIPDSAEEINNRHRTLDRRSKPRIDMGEETIFLNQISGGLIGSKTNYSPPGAGASEAKTIVEPTFWESNKILLSAILILLLAFAVTVIIGRSSHQEETPAPPQLVEAPQSTLKTPMQESTDPQIDQGQSKLAIDEIASARPLQSELPSTTSQNREPSQAIKNNEKVKPTVETETPEQTEVIKNPALLTFAVTPWGEIYIDGKKEGVTPPLKELTISAGKHRIEIRNLNFAPYSETIDIKSGSTKKIKYIFQ
ncbi:serine/threonine protein kinase [Sulfurirhabdus autotrophica]|uniref:non-specific serine/threonine protein kinase n=1 Tax=Sulfurirhabdus autotrophica TaxID=1706046 RepID=A0A4R3Y6Y0_9PROT|nr:serine/threonine-protein kinase [Sulfurirhabdus autotrophica]TCV87372.1 serine/threonine-protein kinase [Sulfurirhabdus autotrophica]